MPLTPQTKLGPCEILASLGAGGMGEVYRARDTRLGRDVAVKVLPEHLTRSVEFKQRFEREAKSISQLSHPHICTLHDVGHQDGIDYLVMELLEGETLAQRLSKGPLPLDQVLRRGVEIASALDVARHVSCQRAHRRRSIRRCPRRPVVSGQHQAGRQQYADYADVQLAVAASRLTAVLCVISRSGRRMLSSFWRNRSCA